MYERMKREYSRRKLLLGVDRLDYSKGLPQRMRAFRELLAALPREPRSSATLIQIASPTREDVERLRRHPARAGEPVRRDQRQLRRARLDAGALHPPHRGAQRACRACTAPAAWRW